MTVIANMSYPRRWMLLELPVPFFLDLLLQNNHLLIIGLLILRTWRAGFVQFLNRAGEVKARRVRVVDVNQVVAADLVQGLLFEMEMPVHDLLVQLPRDALEESGLRIVLSAQRLFIASYGSSVLRRRECQLSCLTSQGRDSVEALSHSSLLHLLHRQGNLWRRSLYPSTCIMQMVFGSLITLDHHRL